MIVEGNMSEKEYRDMFEAINASEPEQKEGKQNHSYDCFAWP
jgi:hypothetical protein